MFKDNTLMLHGLMGGSRTEIEASNFKVLKNTSISFGTTGYFSNYISVTNTHMLHFDSSTGSYNIYRMPLETSETGERFIYKNDNCDIRGAVYSAGDMVFVAYKPKGGDYLYVDAHKSDGTFVKTYSTEKANRYWVFTGTAYDPLNKRYFLSFHASVAYTGDVELLVITDSGLKMFDHIGTNENMPLITGETKVKNGEIFARTKDISSTECNIIRYDYVNNSVIAKTRMDNEGFFYYSTKFNKVVSLVNGTVMDNQFRYEMSVEPLPQLKDLYGTKYGYTPIQQGGCESDDIIFVNGVGQVLGYYLTTTKTTTGVRTILASTYSNIQSIISSDYPNRRGQVSPNGKYLVGSFTTCIVYRR
ncbi:hypothetical protein EXN54_20555 [Clostridium botulinum]|nr:hypothetical protein [Clostridium botulinum]